MPMAAGLANPVNEFYKKGCQEKKLRLDRRRDFVLDIQPTAVSVSPDSPGGFSLACLPCGVHLPMVTTPIESGKVGKRVLVSSVSTMVLSEARGLSLFLVIRGGIACNG
jgi:hypothetical protein